MMVLYIAEHKMNLMPCVSLPVSKFLIFHVMDITKNLS